MFSEFLDKNLFNLKYISNTYDKHEENFER
ncbi:hypothetical protein LA55_1263 [Francisella philomiragia]|uniref:Uncharacterized protein n=1 Tax=Francisella philomiragia TaxID=28110 RepID=A0A0B6D4X8_9GAMM|nr:hypothetical protein LA55_1263 [Francisella philomiragia]